MHKTLIAGSIAPGCRYLQAINQVNALSTNPHVWTHDGPDAELYGLEPNYGCCTANFNQGWPKWASMVV